MDATGRDEVAAVAASFNQAAERIEALVRSHQSLLANASHELRSPLARLKMALSLLEDAPPAQQRERLKAEIGTNIGELDALVEEVLLASRLDAQQAQPRDRAGGPDRLAAEEGGPGRRRSCRPRRPRWSCRATSGCCAARCATCWRTRAATAAVRSPCSAQRVQAATRELRVCDRGPGVPEALRERIFEPFFRLPGHAEREGGVGLGLALVKQIAGRHGGQVRCEAHDGGGSCFVLSLPAG